MRIVAVLIVIVASVLGYGYWHAATHATLDAQFRLREANSLKPLLLPGAEVEFLNDVGQVLARGVSDARFNYVHLRHPVVGDCHEKEQQATASQASRTAWQVCFAQLATWIPQWVESVRAVHVRYKDCEYPSVPVEISASAADWYLWWVPLPHVGGVPYSYYRASIVLDDAGCLTDAGIEPLS